MIRSKVFCWVKQEKLELLICWDLFYSGLKRSSAQRNVGSASQLSLPSNSATVAAVLSHHKLYGAFSLQQWSVSLSCLTLKARIFFVFQANYTDTTACSASIPSFIMHDHRAPPLMEFNYLTPFLFFLSLISNVSRTPKEALFTETTVLFQVSKPLICVRRHYCTIFLTYRCGAVNSRALGEFHLQLVLLGHKMAALHSNLPAQPRYWLRLCSYSIPRLPGMNCLSAFNTAAVSLLIDRSTFDVQPMQ